MLKNNNYHLPQAMPNDPNMERISKLILPFVRIVRTSWGKFKPSIIQKQSTTLPAAYLTRYGTSNIEDISGNSQKLTTQYAIAIVLQDHPEYGDDHAIYIENGVAQALQDYSLDGQKLENLKTADATSEASLNNNIRTILISFEIPLTFEPQNNKLNAWLYAEG